MFSTMALVPKSGVRPEGPVTRSGLKRSPIVAVKGSMYGRSA